MLTLDEQRRYIKQAELPGFGMDGQEKLKKTKVLIAGAGGLGSAAAIYLAAAGLGRIRVIDSDKVELSNLNRQVLYSNQDVGRKKVDVCVERLKTLNPFVELDCIEAEINEGNVRELVNGCDVIVDALDNLPTRYLLNNVAIARNTVLVHGGVYGFQGRVTTIIPKKTPCLRCLYRNASPPKEIPVIGFVPGIIGCLQAAEVIKYVLGIGTLLTGKLLIYDGLSSEFLEVQMAADPNCPECESGARDER